MDLLLPLITTSFEIAVI